MTDMKEISTALERIEGKIDQQGRVDANDTPVVRYLEARLREARDREVALHQGMDQINRAVTELGAIAEIPQQGQFPTVQVLQFIAQRVEELKRQVPTQEPRAMPTYDLGEQVVIVEGGDWKEGTIYGRWYKDGAWRYDLKHEPSIEHPSGDRSVNVPEDWLQVAGKETGRADQREPRVTRRRRTPVNATLTPEQVAAMEAIREEEEEEQR